MGRSFVGIDIGNQNLKIASIRRFGKRYVVESLVSEKLGTMSQRRNNEFNLQGCAAILRRLLDSNRISPINSILGLNGKDVIFRFVEIPPVSDAQIRKLLEYEQAAASKGITAETITDYQLLNIPRETPATLALVGTARSSDLDEDTRMLSTAKIRTTGVVPKSIALHKLLGDSGLVTESETVMLLDVGEEATEIVLSYGRNLVLARTVNIGGHSFTEAISKEFNVIPEVAEEIKLAEGSIIVAGKRPSLMSEFREGFDDLIAAEGIRFRNDPRYPSNLSKALTTAADQIRMAADSALRFAMVQTKVKNLKIDRIILSGGGAKLPGLLEYFNSKLRVPVNYWDVLGSFEIANVPPDKRDVPTEFANALALAYVAAGNSTNVINLVPEKIKEQHRFWNSEIFAYVGAALFVIAFVLWWLGAGSLASTMSDMRTNTGALSSQAKQRSDLLDRNTEEMTLTNDRISKLSRESYYNPIVLKFLIALQEAVPKTVKLTGFQFESFTATGGVIGPKTVLKPDWRFVVEGFVSKDVPALQHPQILQLLEQNISKLPFIVRSERTKSELIEKTLKSKGNPVAIVAGSYVFAVNFIVSQDGGLKHNEIKP